MAAHYLLMNALGLFKVAYLIVVKTSSSMLFFR